MTQPSNPTPDQETEVTPSPRAFAQGVGLVLQTVGFILFMSSCCICSVAGLWDPTLTRGQVVEQLEQAKTIGIDITTLFNEPAKAGLMLTVMFATIVGLALAVFGLGLQSEKRG